MMLKVYVVAFTAIKLLADPFPTVISQSVNHVTFSLNVAVTENGKVLIL